MTSFKICTPQYYSRDQIREDELGGTCVREMQTGFCLGHLKE